MRLNIFCLLRPVSGENIKVDMGTLVMAYDKNPHIMEKVMFVKNII